MGKKEVQKIVRDIIFDLREKLKDQQNRWDKMIADSFKRGDKELSKFKMIYENDPFGQKFMTEGVQLDNIQFPELKINVATNIRDNDRDAIKRFCELSGKSDLKKDNDWWMDMQNRIYDWQFEAVKEASK